MKSFIKTFEKCKGISFPAIGRYKVEIWTAPAGYSIKPHTHDNEDIKLIFLWGNNVRFHRRKKGSFISESFFAMWNNIGKMFNIRAGDEHSFDVSDTRLIFMNIETWKDGVVPTSASEDLTFTK
jgi:hypothetical protein